MKKESVLISLGGSLIFPDEIDIGFLERFRNLILKYLNKKRFLNYVGGGKIARIYQEALAKFGARERELDWLGILITRVNAYLLKNIFKNYCHSEIIYNPTKRIKVKKDILIYAGWKPGWSTDYDAVLLAKNFRTKEIINLTNIDYVYDQDPKKFPRAKPLKRISWSRFREIVGKKWKPGLSLPFDPIAAKLSQKLKIKIVIINGKKLERLEKILNN